MPANDGFAVRVEDLHKAAQMLSSLSMDVSICVQSVGGGSNLWSGSVNSWLLGALNSYRDCTDALTTQLSQGTDAIHATANTLSAIAIVYDRVDGNG